MSATAQVSQLHISKPVQQPLAPKEVHSYVLRLEEGQYVHLIAEQFGVDVELRLLDPAGSLVVRRDSLTEARGEEAVHAVASVSGDFSVEVVGLVVEDDEPRPAYQLRIETLRLATTQDRARAIASQSFGREDYEEAITAWSSTGDFLDEAKSHFRRALQLLEREGVDAAFRALRTSRTLFEKADSKEVGARRLYGTVLDRLSEEHRKRGKRREALETAREAATIFRAVGPERAWATSLIRIGSACNWLDLTEDGMQALEDAIDVAREIRAKDLEISARRTLAQFQYQRNALDAARREWKRVETLAAELGDQEALHTAQRWQIRLLIREDRFADAREPLEAHLEKHSGTASDRMSVLQDAVELYLGLGELDAARACVDRGLQLSRDQGDIAYEAMFLHLLGRQHHALGNHEDSLQLQTRAGELFRRADDRQGAVSAQYVRAQSLYALDRYEEAAELLDEIVGSAETLRSDSLGHDLRSSYMDSRRHYWELYVDTLMRLHDASPEAKFDQIALVASESARARSLYDQLFEAEVRSQDESSPLRRRRQQVRDKLHELELEAPRRETQGGVETATLERQRSELLDILDQLDRRSRTLHALPEAPPKLSVSELQHEILRQARTSMVAYFVGQHGVYAWWISPDGLESSRLDVTPDDLDATARAWASMLPERHDRAREHRRQLAVELGELLLTPFSKKIQGGRLVIVPDGALHGIPFSALIFPVPTPEGRRRYLVERNEIVQIPSVSVLQRLRQAERDTSSPTESTREIVVFANPAYSRDSSDPSAPSIPPVDPIMRAVRNLGRDDLKPLRHTLEEADGIRKAAEAQNRPCRLLVDRDAQKSVLLNEDLGKMHALHFATHGLLDPTHPELSGLVLSLVDENGKSVDGYLRLHEIYDLRLDARLAVLSACETGLGRELRGEGMISLTRGFFQAGVPRVVASLWSVDDLSTAELMSRFYRFHLENRWLPSSALNAAQRSMLDDPEWDDPFYWAAFVYHGDWSMAVDLGDDPIGGVAVEPPEPEDPPGDSEVPFFLSGVDNGDDEDDDEDDTP